PATITLTSGEILISDSLTIIGTNSNSTTVPPTNATPMINVSGNQSSRIFNINGPGTLSVSFYGLGFLSGKAAATGSALLSGGALSFANGGQASIDSSTLSNNLAGTSGGGLHYVGSPNTASPLFIRNSTMSGNDATVSGGAVALAAFGNGVLVIANSTVTDNA